MKNSITNSMLIKKMITANKLVSIKNKKHVLVTALLLVFTALAGYGQSCEVSGGAGYGSAPPLGSPLDGSTSPFEQSLDCQLLTNDADPITGAQVHRGFMLSLIHISEPTRPY